MPQGKGTEQVSIDASLPQTLTPSGQQQCREDSPQDGGADADSFQRLVPKGYGKRNADADEHLEPRYLPPFWLVASRWFLEAGEFVK